MGFFDPIISLFKWLFISIVDWVTNKLYQSSIVFTTVWEDPRCDAAVLNLKKSDSMVIITSAGCNALEHALAGIKVYCVDKNPCQNALMDLKLAAIKTYDYNVFWKMFGEGKLPNFRRDYYPKLRKLLPPSSQRFWDSRTHYFESTWIGTPSLYNRGCSGVVGWITRLCIQCYPGLYPAVKDLFEAKTTEEQRKIYFSRIEKKLWNPIISWMATSPTILSWTGIPESQQKLLEKEMSMGKFMKTSLETALVDLPIHENHFWRIYAVGNYKKDCCPEYLKEENFNKLKAGLVNNVSTHTLTVTEYLNQHNGDKISKFLLLDHMDWLVDKHEILSEEWQSILDHCTPDAQFLFRSCAQVPTFVTDTQVTFNGKKCKLGELITFEPKKTEALHKVDRVHTYVSFHSAKLNA